jgi:nicotinamidase/pyrazinamidase
MTKNNALLIIDVQNDFCPGGSLPVPEGDKIITIINKISGNFYKVIATQDWHPADHISFAVNHNKKPYEKIKIGDIEQVLWPIHCVPGTYGADFHRDLMLNYVDLILRKGTDSRIDSYSAFFENDKKTETGLKHYLKGLKIKDIYICGLATDYCVYYTAIDAKKSGFNTYVILDATRGVNVPEGNVENTINDMKKRGIEIINHESIL